MEVSRLHFGALWGHFGLHVGSLGSIWPPFGVFGEAFGVHWGSVESFLDVQRAKRVPERVSHVIVMLYHVILSVFLMVSTTFPVVFVMLVNQGNVVEAAPQAQPKTT